MKKTKFLVLAALAAMFVGCQSEEPEQISGNDRPGPTGDTRIIIEGEGMLDTQSRSSDGRVDFTGGYATGAGLYDGNKAPTVAAYPNAGYEVSYFYGGPDSQPKKYDYSQSGESEFKVPLGGQDHTFHCGFKEKKRTLTVNAGSGGKVSPSGTKEYQVEKPISITATPNSGYEFSGWSITGGDVTIANSNSSSTTATLHNSNSTITAKFKKSIKDITIIYNTENNYYISSSSQVNVSLRYSGHYVYNWGRDNGQSGHEERDFTKTDGEPYPDSYNYDDGYGNYESQSSIITGFVVYANGEIIFESSSKFPTPAKQPNDGEIINGYRYTRKVE